MLVVYSSCELDRVQSMVAFAHCGGDVCMCVCVCLVFAEHG